MTGDRVDALRRAVAAAPGDHTLRLLLADAYHDEGRHREALTELAVLLGADALPGDAALRGGDLALDLDADLGLARGFLAAARDRGVVDGALLLQRRIEATLAERGAEPQPVTSDPGGLALAFESGTTFADVGGLAEVKKVLHRLVVLPQSRGDLLRRYGRRAGGGVLLYGPPGCGKTLLARAVAGECGVPFLNVRIEDVLDPFHGMSERNLHEVFARARDRSPSVVHLDEVDAIGYARRKQRDGAIGRTLVDLLLQELDAIGADNEGVTVMASTNAPWDLDDALLRPGRFDRRIFVPPPDEAARAAILERLLDELPVVDADPRRLAAVAELCSGADLRAAVERAVDDAIEVALDSGGEPPVDGRRIAEVLQTESPTTLAWLETARAHVEFANASGRWDDVARFVATRSVRRRMGR